MDISQAMVDHFNARVAYQGIPVEEMQAFCCELKGEEGELEDRKFDVIVVRRLVPTRSLVHADLNL